MRYVKMEDGWLCVEKEIKYPYGSLFLLLYNCFFSEYNEYNNALVDLLDSGHPFNSAPIKELEKEYAILTEHFDVYEMLIDIIETYLYHDGGHIEDMDFETNENSKLSHSEQLNRHHSIIETLKKNGWFDISNKTKISLIDKFLLSDFLSENPTFSVTTSFINHKWYPTYIVNNEDLVFFCFLDLMEIRNMPNLEFAHCANCEIMYIKQNSKQKYCPDCSRNYKAISDQKRKETPRGLHQKVSNYLRNSDKFTLDEQADFNNESNYYWDIIKGKTPENTHDYLDISCEQDYVQWLNNKHQTFKEIAKTRTKC